MTPRSPHHSPTICGFSRRAHYTHGIIVDLGTKHFNLQWLFYPVHGSLSFIARFPLSKAEGFPALTLNSLEYSALDGGHKTDMVPFCSRGPILGIDVLSQGRVLAVLVHPRRPLDPPVPPSMAFFSTLQIFPARSQGSLEVFGPDVIAMPVSPI